MRKVDHAVHGYPMPLVRSSRSPFSLAEEVAAIGAGNLRQVAAGVADEQTADISAMAGCVGKSVIRLETRPLSTVLEGESQFIVLGPGDGRG